MRGVSLALTTVALSPVLLYQGRRVRRTVPRLPEPPGPREGTTGQGPSLSVLIVGDSAAAGVGAPDQHTALTGQLVARLSRHHTVTYRLVATTGHRTQECISALQQLPPARYDVALTSLGVNDATGLSRPRSFIARQRALLDTLRTRHQVGHVVLSGVPPVGRFPALPWPLRPVIGAYADGLHAALRDLAASEASATFLDLRDQLDLTGDHMAADGFHPGPHVYARWAELACAMIRQVAPPP